VLEDKYSFSNHNKNSEFGAGRNFKKTQNKLLVQYTLEMMFE